MSVINLSTIFFKKNDQRKMGKTNYVSSTVAKKPSPIMVQSATVRAVYISFQ